MDLLKAINDKDEEAVAALLSQSQPGDIRRALAVRRDANGAESEWTPLMEATGRGVVGIVEKLVAAGAAVDDNVDGITALMVACMTTPLHTAAEVVSVLLSANADPNLGDSYRETYLMRASYRGLTDVVDVLIKGKADVNARDNFNCTALYFAVKNAHVDTVKRILEAKPDEDVRTQALALASEKELSEIIAVLGGPAPKKRFRKMTPVGGAPVGGAPVGGAPVDPQLSRSAFQKVLAELPVGDGRVGFPSDVSLLLSGVGQSDYARALLAAGFGIAQLIFAGDTELKEAGVRLRPHRRWIMEGMLRFSLRGWAKKTVPTVTSMRSAVHGLCNAVRQVHIMWASSVLARRRNDPDYREDPDLNGDMTEMAIKTIHSVTRTAAEVRRRAATIAALAEAKLAADPAAPADLLCTRCRII